MAPAMAPLLLALALGASFLPSSSGAAKSSVSVYTLQEAVFYAGTASFSGKPASPPCKNAPLPTLPGLKRLPDKGAILSSSVLVEGVLESFPTDKISPLPVPTLNITKAKVGGFNGLDAVQSTAAGSKPVYARSNGFKNPPDVSGCVGGNYIVQLVNRAIAVYNKKGKLVAQPVPFNQFFGLNPFRKTSTNAKYARGDDISEASCIYDRFLNRFIFTAAWKPAAITGAWSCFGQDRSQGLGGNNQGSALVLAISAEGAPTKDWDVYFIPTTNDGKNSSDDSLPPLSLKKGPFDGKYPQLGIDENGVYISTDEIGNDFSSAAHNIYAVSKKALVAQKNFLGLRFVAPVTKSSSLIGLQSFFPVKTTGEAGSETNSQNGGTFYFVSTSVETGRPVFGVWALTNTASLSSAKPSLRLHLSLLKRPAYGDAPYRAFQRGDKDFAVRVLTASYALYTAPVLSGGKLWLTWLVAGDIISDEVTRTAAAVAQIVPSFSGKGSKLKLGTSLGKSGAFQARDHYVLFPVLTFNTKGKGVLAFSLTGLKYFPSAAYVTLDDKGTISSSITLAAKGKTNLVDVHAPDELPYGHWQTITVDSKGSAWAFVEYVTGQGVKDEGNWATRVFSPNF